MVVGEKRRYGEWLLFDVNSIFLVAMVIRRFWPFSRSFLWDVIFCNIICVIYCVADYLHSFRGLQIKIGMMYEQA